MQCGMGLRDSRTVIFKCTILQSNAEVVKLYRTRQFPRRRIAAFLEAVHMKRNVGGGEG